MDYLCTDMYKYCCNGNALIFHDVYLNNNNNNNNQNKKKDMLA